MIKLQTNMGDIVIRLDHEKTPVTADNFLRYVREGFYDGTIFHRVIDNFMIQGGGFDETMSQKLNNDQIINEADKGGKNTVGSVAMARTSDPHSASSQFFINVKDNDFLNHQEKSDYGWGYCVFGQVVDGMDTVNAIKAVATGSHGGHQDVPTTPVVIEKAFCMEEQSV